MREKIMNGSEMRVGVKIAKILISSLVFSVLAMTGSVQSSIASTTSPMITSFTFNGSGFGHGVGLSQIGAKGMALAGKNVSEILGYYFPGTELTPVSDTQTIRVNLAHQAPKINISLNSPSGLGSLTLINQSQISSSTGNSATTSSTSSSTSSSTTSSNQSISQSGAAAPNQTPFINTFNATYTINFSISSGNIIATSQSGSMAPTVIGSATTWVVNWSGADSIVGVREFTSTTQIKYGSLEIDAVPYASGKYRIEVVNLMSLHDQYMYGVSEVPPTWPIAAQQAQAIASRTYAYKRLNTIKPECRCNVYASMNDQSFIGYSKENAVHGDRWVSAVNGTDVDSSNAFIITYKKQPIDVYFFSSSGGMTQRSKDVWGTDLPYLQSVPDPWSLSDTLNPGYAHWIRAYSYATVASDLGIPDLTRLVLSGKTPAGANLKVVAYSASGAKKIFTMGVFKSLVHLPSSWFTITTQ